MSLFFLFYFRSLDTNRSLSDNSTNNNDSNNKNNNETKLLKAKLTNVQFDLKEKDIQISSLNNQLNQIKQLQQHNESEILKKSNSSDYLMQKLKKENLNSDNDNNDISNSNNENNARKNDKNSDRNLDVISLEESVNVLMNKNKKIQEEADNLSLDVLRLQVIFYIQVVFLLYLFLFSVFTVYCGICR